MKKAKGTDVMLGRQVSIMPGMHMHNRPQGHRSASPAIVYCLYVLDALLLHSTALAHVTNE